MTTRTPPLVSVIVPVYNVEAYLDACLDSVRGQTYRNLEVLLVEDCSTDDSLQVLEKHLADERVRLLQHERNGGLSAARNTGIEAARGDYLLFVDSDDLVEPDLVAACVACALANDADLVLFDFAPFLDGETPRRLSDQASGAPEEAPVPDSRFFKLPNFAWLKLIRTSLVREHRLRFPVGYYYEDAPFHWALGLHAASTFHLGRSYYHYRQRTTSITGSGREKLFHLFAVQLLIAEALEEEGHGPRTRGFLAEKVYSSIWFVAISIDEDLLEEALPRIKHHLRGTRSVRTHARPTAKAAVLLALLRLPHPLALAAIRSLRNVLAVLSPARRPGRRKVGAAQQPRALASMQPDG